jgi:hypothetical protein
VSVLLPPLLLAAALLLVSGTAKLRAPEPAASALRELGVPGARWAVPAGAVAELAVAAAIVIRAREGAAAASALFVLFALLVSSQLRRGSTRSCGCLGAADTLPSRIHLVLNLLLALAAAAAALRPPPPPFAELAHHPFEATVVALAAATCAWLVAAGLPLVPAALAAYRRPT